MLFLLLIVLILIFVIFSSFYTVRNKEAAVIERLGKFQGISYAGLHFKAPFVDKIRDVISLQVRQLDVAVETKTKDNVFVEIPVAVQYKVVEGREEQAFYALTNHEQQIVSYVQDTVRTSVAKLTLDDAFASKDEIARDVEESLKDSMEQYGWQFINTLITDISPDRRVRESMNAINASKRERDAAVQLAEAEKLRVIKEAEGEAEARRLQGEGIAQQRMEIAKGLAAQYAALEEVDVANPESIMFITQYLDTLVDVANKSHGAVMFMPNNAGAVTDMATELRTAMQSSFMLEENAKSGVHRKKKSSGSTKRDSSAVNDENDSSQQESRQQQPQQPQLPPQQAPQHPQLPGNLNNIDYKNLAQNLPSQKDIKTYLKRNGK